MAGMPPSLISRANQILRDLEESRGSGTQALSDGLKKVAAPQFQLSIFDSHSETFDQIRKLLQETDINRLTPVEALIRLSEIKSLVR